MSPEPVRVLALWSPDWPVTAAARAAHVPPHRPAAVIVANRVLACSAVARAHGVRRGLRRREAQARCPELAVLPRDPDRDARAFEPVVVAVEELAPGVEIVRPGLVVLPARGPAGYFGGELAVAERLVDQVAARTGVECQVGVADGLFAAVLAARRGLAVGAGDTPAFLAPLGVEELDRDPGIDRSELVGLLRRLGLRSLGAFGALDPEDVASRFGADAVLCHRLARGLDPRPPVRRRPPEELTVEIELDPPVERVDAAAFAARGLAERLHRTLAGHGLSCTRLGVAARTVSGEQLHRVWRCAEPLTPAGTVDRVRWQLDAWLTRRRTSNTGTGEPTEPADGGPGAVARLWLVPEETVTAGALQLGLWGEVGEADERAGRALVRIQALLGPESVFTAVLTGGRDPGERVRLVPWGDDREDGAEPDPIRGVPGTADRAVAVEPGWSPPTGGAAPGRLTLLSDGSAPVGSAAPDLRSGDPVPASTGERRPPTASGLSGSGSGGSDPDLERAMLPLDVNGRVAPAGWPPDVVRRTGRISAIDVLNAPAGSGDPGPAERAAGARSGPASIRPHTGEHRLDDQRPDDQRPDDQRLDDQRLDDQRLDDQRLDDQRLDDQRLDDQRLDDQRLDDQRLDDQRPGDHRSTNRRRRPPVRRSPPTPTRPEPPAPWPGRLPTPSPATVPPEPVPAELVDAEGRPIWLVAPERLSAPPHRLTVDGAEPREVEGWAGPWPTRQRWWAPDGVTSSRLQLLCSEGAAFLLASRDGRWWVTGIYD